MREGRPVRCIKYGGGTDGLAMISSLLRKTLFLTTKEDLYPRTEGLCIKQESDEEAKVIQDNPIIGISLRWVECLRFVS